MSTFSSLSAPELKKRGYKNGGAVDIPGSLASMARGGDSLYPYM
jgi:hypothetical protein